MSESIDVSQGNVPDRGKDIFTEIIMAGKRKYFIDVKKLKSDIYYLVITESVKCCGKDDVPEEFKKFRIVLFPEDFGKFVDGINNAIDFIKKELMPKFDFEKFNKSNIIKKSVRENDSEYDSIVKDINV